MIKLDLYLEGAVGGTRAQGSEEGQARTSVQLHQKLASFRKGRRLSQPLLNQCSLYLCATRESCDVL